MIVRLGWFTWVRCLPAALGLLVGAAGAHTLPVSYLRLAPDADYLHLELVFNPFELTFVSEVDDNHDNELDPAELQAHGQAVADRVTAAIKLSAGETVLTPETTGMDPDLNGHHVRLRAHYKFDARRLPLTVESDLNAITSGSHLTQTTYANGTNTQMAQLDSASRSATFNAPPEVNSRPPLSRQHAVLGGFLMLMAVMVLLVAGAGILVFMRRRIEQ